MGWWVGPSYPARTAGKQHEVDAGKRGWQSMEYGSWKYLKLQIEKPTNTATLQLVYFTISYVPAFPTPV